jgi:hypothetical protein
MLTILPRTATSRCLDLLLLLPALLLVLVEHVLWAGSRAILHGIAGLAPVRAAQLWLELLPPYAAVPLFLVPEMCSHGAGIWATVLLARGHVVTATSIAVLFKGAATLVLVWIYQATEPALLRVAWFARLHDGVLAARRLVLDRVVPLRAAALRRLRSSVARAGWLGHRFQELRMRLAVGLDNAWPKACNAMRYTLMLAVLLALAGCSGTPADLGITGPTAPAEPQAPDDSTIDRPGLPDPMSGYGPSFTPSTGGGRFYNYN